MAGMIMCYGFFVFIDPSVELADDLKTSQLRVTELKEALADKTCPEIVECAEAAVAEPKTVYIQEECYCDDSSLNTTKGFLGLCEANIKDTLAKNEELVYLNNSLATDLKSCLDEYPWAN